MKIFVHYCSYGFSNCYIIVSKAENADRTDPPRRHDALIVDPGAMEGEMLQFIEKENCDLKGVLITHNHENHVRGLRALMRIYDAQIYAVAPKVFDCPSTIIRDGDKFSAGRFLVSVTGVPGHSADSVIYKISNCLFTGDALSAGMLGSTPNSYGAIREIAKIQNTIFPLHGNLLIFPGHGPPTSLNIERKYNVGIEKFHENVKKNERRGFNLELLDS